MEKAVWRAALAAEISRKIFYIFSGVNFQIAPKTARIGASPCNLGLNWH